MSSTTPNRKLTPTRAARAEATLRDPRWAAVIARGPASGAAFVYAVETTGVYCRPACGARTPRPEHVTFFPTTAAAERAGYRACKRCRPTDVPATPRNAELVAELCRYIDAAEAPPSLAELAARAELGVDHLSRIFKAVTGLTPRAYAMGARARRLRSELSEGETVTRALFDAGFGSTGRFYAQANGALGMTPSAYRDGGKETAIRFAVAACSLGAILVAASERGVCAISLGDDPDALVHALEDRFPRAELVGGDPAFEALVARVVGLVESPGTGHELPLDVRGTAFQLRVWRALREIPPGTTATYTEIAARIGAPDAVRAVAGACAANAHAVAIPCHRVVRRDGALSGYRWGVERKAALLAREGAR